MSNTRGHHIGLPNTAVQLGYDPFALRFGMFVYLMVSIEWSMHARSRLTLPHHPMMRSCIGNVLPLPLRVKVRVGADDVMVTVKRHSIGSYCITGWSH